MPQFTIADPTPADLDFLEERLYEFNVAATGIEDGRFLGVFLRDESGAILAAAAGHTWGGTCELKQVWVAESLRGTGIGRRLMAEAEEEAKRRGCRQILLSTFSFQAPGFYGKLGYEMVAELREYPRGASHFVMRKDVSSEQ